MKPVDIYQVDAFTDVAFGGNPAGVVPDATGLSKRQCRRSPEMALGRLSSMTPGERAADFDVRATAGAKLICAARHHRRLRLLASWGIKE